MCYFHSRYNFSKNRKNKKQIPSAYRLLHTTCNKGGHPLEPTNNSETINTLLNFTKNNLEMKQNGTISNIVKLERPIF